MLISLIYKNYSASMIKNDEINTMINDIFASNENISFKMSYHESLLTGYESS